jgi:hypothetical protein
MPGNASETPIQTYMGLTSEQTLASFKFYEEAAEKAKSHAWSQTTWILALNAGIMAFSLKFYAEHSTVRGFLLIEVISAGVGIVLSAFLIYLLQELGGHISHYWTTSNKIAATYAPLTSFIGEKDADQARTPHYRAGFPAFCRRLQFLAGLFIAAHAGWTFVVAGCLTSR